MEQTYFRWRKEYGGLQVDQAKRLKELEQENGKQESLGCKYMSKPINIVDVEIIQGCGIVVTFSDGTAASYPSEELAELRPYREPGKSAIIPANTALTHP